MKDDYWAEFWNNSEIIYKKGVHEKVGRTIGGRPIKDSEWEIILKDLQRHLQLNKQDNVLDIAAGSGAIAIPFCGKVNSYLALDISKELLGSITLRQNLKTCLTDVRTVYFENSSFTKIIFYFALQHFSELETIMLFKKIYHWLNIGGIAYIGDIPDDTRKFDFFNTPERFQAYILSIESGRPIIGNWYNPIFLSKIAYHIGFRDVEIIQQPTNYINSHYRFDIKLIK
jgi:SAM-dependent methyltransferase